MPPTTAEKTSSDQAPPQAVTAAPVPEPAGGPVVNGMTPADMQQRFGNQGAGAMLLSQESGDGGGGAVSEELGEAVAAGEAAMAAMSGAPILVDAGQAVAPTTDAVRARASTAREHSDPETPVGAAQASAIVPYVASEQDAASRTVSIIEDEATSAEDEGLDAQSFKDELTDALIALVPEFETEEEANRLLEQGTGGLADKVGGTVTANTDAASDDLTTAADPENAAQPNEDAPREGPELVEEPLGQPLGPVSAESVVPPAYPDSQLDYSGHAAPTEQLMADNQITREQLATSNEPDLMTAAQSQSEAQAHGEAAPAAYRDVEAGVRSQGRADAVAGVSGGIEGFTNTRSDQISSVVETQGETLSADERKRQEIRDHIIGIRDQTTTDVNTILSDMTTEAESIFDTGLSDAETDYTDTFEDEKPGFLDKAGNFVVAVFGFLGGGGFEWDDGLTEAFNAAKNAYDRRVKLAVDEVATLVEAKLAEAARRVERGRKDVEDYVDELDESVKTYGEEAQIEVSADFDALETRIDESRSALIDSLVSKYEASQQRLAAEEQRLREENKSWWQKAWDATVGAVQKILEIKNLLMEVLAGAYDVVLTIISDPVQFLSNLITGLKDGLNNFLANIWNHLREGFMGWLFGAMAEAGITMPTSFDAGAIIGLIVQVLGVTYRAIRGIAVEMLGEEAVARLEQFAEIFSILMTEGLGGAWEYIREQLGQLKDMLMEEIQNWLITEVIEAGIKWILGLMSPVGALIKAAMAIYDIVMFFIDRGQQILDLVNAVIGAIRSIANGDTNAMSASIEQTLARMIPVAIGFLASLLGLGGISAKIRGFIDAVKEKIMDAVRWLINKAVELVKRAGNWLFGLGESDIEDEQGAVDDPEKQDAVDAALIFLYETEARYGAGGLSLEEANDVARIVLAAHPVLSDIELVVEQGTSLIYLVSASPAFQVPSKVEPADTEELPPGIPEFGPYDESNDRPTGVFVALTHANLGTGTPAGYSPAAYQKGKKLARGHLLGKQLGGDGKDKRNIVVIDQHTNNTKMKSQENAVAASLRAKSRKHPHSKLVLYEVTPIYDSDSSIPSTIRMTAVGDPLVEGGDEFGYDVPITNRASSLLDE